MAAGKTAVFTVKAKEGYAIKDVYSLAAEVTPVGDAELASASNAQEETDSDDQDDPVHFQTYLIDDVTDDAEIIIEMEAEGVALLNLRTEADAVVTPEMTTSQIQEILDGNNAVAFEAGDYSEAIVNASDSKTIILSEGTYSGIGFVISDDTRIEYSGNVVISGGTCPTDYGKTPFNLQSGNLQFFGSEADDRLEIQDCGIGIYLNTDADKAMHIETGTLAITNAEHKGVFAVGKGDFTLNIQGSYESTENSRVGEEANAVDLYDTAFYITESGAGIYDCSEGQFDVKINGAYVNLSGNRFSGFYAGDQPETANGNSFEITDGCLISSDNAGTGLAYSYTKNGNADFFVTRSYVEFNNNTVNGINGGIQHYTDSVVISSGSGRDNIEAQQVIADNTQFTVEKAVRYGIRMY